jgi:hypothetical protein
MHREELGLKTADRLLKESLNLLVQVEERNAPEFRQSSPDGRLSNTADPCDENSHPAYSLTTNASFAVPVVHACSL